MKPHLHSGGVYKGMKIGLLGGSFNPAHEGHLAMSLHALRQLGCDQIWWLVSPQNPLKATTDMDALDRRLVQAKCIATHPRLVVSDIESQLGTHYTVDTLRGLRRHFPHTRFIWLMGADNLRQISHWRDWQNIFRLVPVAVFRRPAYPAGRGMGKAAIRFGKAWRPATKGRLLADAKRPAWIIFDNKLNSTSATQIRKDKTTWRS